jgi:hypothetical protein
MVQTELAKVRLQMRRNVQKKGQFLELERNTKTIFGSLRKNKHTLDRDHEIPKTNFDRLGLEKQPICTLVNLRIPSLNRVQSSLGA